METSGWIFLALSWGLSVGLVTFCFYHIFYKDKKDKAE